MGRELYYSTIAPLAMHFDGDSKNINLFLNQLTRRADISSWQSGIHAIISIPDSKGINKKCCLDMDL